MKFRKKPVVVEAVQFRIADHFDGKRVHEDIPGVQTRAGGGHREFYIETLEGAHIVSDGDWIITGVAGEHYPCKPAIFAETYEPAEPSAERTPFRAGHFTVSIRATGYDLADVGKMPLAARRALLDLLPPQTLTLTLDELKGLLDP